MRVKKLTQCAQQMYLAMDATPGVVEQEEAVAALSNVIPFAEALAYYEQQSRAEALNRILARSET